MANFDKYNCFRNIRELLRGKDFRIGNIEKEAGCQPGYMSRLEKENNTTDPSMEFIVTAAKMLNVPVDVLLKGDFSGMTDEERCLVEFLDQLMTDTVEGSLDWKLETAQFLSFDMEVDSDTHKVKHPFFLRAEDDVENLYQTKIPGSDLVDIKGNSYHCHLTYTESSVYLMSVVECNVPQPKSFYELYLVENDEEPYVITPICSSKEIRGAIAAKIDKLYDLIEKRASHVYINSDAGLTIARYLTRGALD